MSTRCFSRVRLLLAGMVITLVVGCEAGFVTEAARENIASFVIDVFTTTVNGTVNPS